MVVQRQGTSPVQWPTPAVSTSPGKEARGTCTNLLWQTEGRLVQRRDELSARDGTLLQAVVELVEMPDVCVQELGPSILRTAVHHRHTHTQSVSTRACSALTRNAHHVPKVPVPHFPQSLPPNARQRRRLASFQQGSYGKFSMGLTWQVFNMPHTRSSAYCQSVHAPSMNRCPDSCGRAEGSCLLPPLPPLPPPIPRCITLCTQ